MKMPRKTKYDYVHFEKAPKGLGLLWDCYDNKNGELLGSLRYEHNWRSYVIEFGRHSAFAYPMFNNECLRDIADFLDQLNERLKGNNNGRKSTTPNK